MMFILIYELGKRRLGQMLSIEINAAQCLR